MATPHVAATAALIIASGVLGRHPTPAQITARLKATARKLGGGGDERLYGAGLVNAAAATAPGGPGAVARTRLACPFGDREQAHAQQEPQAPERCDLAVVGGGIVGLAVARELLARNPRASVCVLEREAEIGTHQTSHNSGVIHAGVYYVPGSLKARLCVEGAREMYEYCEQRGIAHERCGKVIVATDASELGTSRRARAPRAGQRRAGPAPDRRRRHPGARAARARHRRAALARHRHRRLPRRRARLRQRRPPGAAAPSPPAASVTAVEASADARCASRTRAAAPRPATRSSAPARGPTASRSPPAPTPTRGSCRSAAPTCGWCPSAASSCAR
jgi:hypothetical protein